MKILIIGNRSHQFIYNYVKALRENFQEKNLQIDILSQDCSEISFASDKFYDNIYALRVCPLFRKSRVVKLFSQHISFRKYVRALSSYDIVHIHYVENIIIRDVRYFSTHIRGHLIVSIWGSDFLRASMLQKNAMSILFNRANRITIASDKVIEEFKNNYRGTTFLSKIALCRFGLQPLENLISIFKSDTDYRTSKSVLELSESRIAVTIGYNASRLQHHIEIIKYIEQYTLLSSFSEKIEFLLPMTYPKDSEYISEIKQLIGESIFQYTIIEDFLADEEVAHLRIASDVFIQLQPTDMLSGSMLEHLAAANIVITGSWLPYDCLSQWGVCFRQIDELHSIASELYSILCNYDHYKGLCLQNTEKIIDRFRWNKVIYDWLNIYVNECNSKKNSL